MCGVISVLFVYEVTPTVKSDWDLIGWIMLNNICLVPWYNQVFMVCVCIFINYHG